MAPIDIEEPRAPRVSAQVVVKPTEDVPTIDPDADSAYDDDRWGRVIVDFRESDLPAVATIVVRDIFGAPEEVERDAEETRLVELDVRPGEFFVWWHGADGDRWGVSARVVVGRVTRIAASQGKPLTIPSCLGRMEVYVAALAGGPLADASVEIEGEGEGDMYSDEAKATTSATGRCQFEVMRGVYELRVGAYTTSVTVEPGEVTRIDVRHDQEGDLLIRGGPPATSFGIFYVMDSQGNSVPRGTSYGSVGLFRYLRAGRYRVVANISLGYRDRRQLGYVDVVARQHVEMDSGLPGGALRLPVISRLPNGSSWDGSFLVTLVATAETMEPSVLSVLVESEKRTGQGRVWRYEFAALSSGTYKIEVSGKNWKTVSEVVTIGNDRVDFAVEIEPAPKEERNDPE